MFVSLSEIYLPVNRRRLQLPAPPAAERVYICVCSRSLHTVRDCKNPIRPVSVSPQWFSGNVAEREREMLTDRGQSGLLEEHRAHQNKTNML